ncbi:DUF429 domain-containing protein [Sinorhizobium chiapasense]|uniref:DUF429 domain-containing protein n=1 Tax=Sinorhizobium chiapasense TaxID=501572 RepID=A0ABZ2BGF1_9HYPH
MPGLLEVYPHPALVELMRTEKRLPCKQGETRDYWPMETPANRRTKLFETWRVIVAGLDQEVPGASEVLQLPPLEAPSWQLKAFEDMLDAVICAWGGICVFEGSAVQHGDDTSAIWIPGQSFWRRRGAGRDRIPAAMDRTPASDPPSSEDAKRLAAADPVNAYYEAQRRAARSRANGDLGEHWHWAPAKWPASNRMP